jgi:hypothetical protein
VILFSAAALVVSCGTRRAEAPKPVARAPKPGNVTARIAVLPAAPSLEQTYTITYALDNLTDVRLSVLRVETNTGTISPARPGWRQALAEPGQSITVAQVTVKAAAVGVQDLTATFVTDRGSYDAVPIKLTVAAAPGQAAPSPAPAGKIIAQIKVSPNPAPPGQTVTVSYEVTDSSNLAVQVSSIDIDSTAPLLPDNPAWFIGLVSPNSTRIVAQRRFVKNEPGKYELRAKFGTNNGVFDAPDVLLEVAVPPPPPDTGHVSAILEISPNPCPVGASYTIEYQIVNTSTKEMTVNNIQTDLGVLDPSSLEWLTNKAAARSKTTIARMKGEGAAATSRNKTARFATNTGDVVAPSVMLVIE